MPKKICICTVDDTEEQDVLRFDYSATSLIVILGPDCSFYATNGCCTLERQHLSEEIVSEFDIECTLHFGAFDYRTCDPTVAPACVAL